MTPDSVGEMEDDTYTIPMELFAFRQVEWPVSLYFPISRSCPAIIPDRIMQAVVAFRSMVVDRPALLDGSTTVEAAAITRAGRK